MAIISGVAGFAKPSQWAIGTDGELAITLPAAFSGSPPLVVDETGNTRPPLRLFVSGGSVELDVSASGTDNAGMAIQDDHGGIVAIDSNGGIEIDARPTATVGTTLFYLRGKTSDVMYAVVEGLLSFFGAAPVGQQTLAPGSCTPAQIAQALGQVTGLGLTKES